MRIAVISDIHGNRLALEAVLEDIERHGVDMTLNLGDLVSGPLEPGRTADLLLECDFPTVRGNHERVLIANGAPALDPVDRFAHRDLKARHLDWFADLPATLAINSEIYMCHGTPKDDNARWLDDFWHDRVTTLPDEAAVTVEADGLDYPVLLCGHTHVARAVRLSDARLIVNPGSVGLQMVHGSPDARYAILDRHASRWSVMLCAIPYDHAAAAVQARRNGFPNWVPALTTGWAGPEGLF
jgi:predicted phosphodiesterase